MWGRKHLPVLFSWSAANSAIVSSIFTFTPPLNIFDSNAVMLFLSRLSSSSCSHVSPYDWAAYDLQKCLHSYLEWLWVVTEQNLCNQRNFAGGSTTTCCIFDLEYYMENPCRQLLSWDCYYNPRNKHRGFNQRYTCVYILAFLERSCIFCCNAYSALEFFLCRFTKTVFPDASSAINNSAFSSTNGKVCVVNHGYAVLLFPQYFLVTLRTVLGDLR